MTFEVHERAWQIVCGGVTPTAALEAEMRASAVLCTEVALEVATQAFRFAGGSALHTGEQAADVHAGHQRRRPALRGQRRRVRELGQYMLGLPEANAYY